MIRVLIVALCLLFTVPGVARGETPTELATRAGELVRTAIEIRGDDPDRSDALLREAVGLYRLVEQTDESHNAALERTLGGASLMLGDTGRAVLHLRRSQRLDPTDARTRETLKHARDQVRSGVAPSAGSRLREVALWWRGRVPRSVVLYGSLIAWGGAWTLAIARRVRRWERGGIAIGILIAGALVGGGTLASERLLDRASREAVLVEDGVMARNGPSADVYPPTFTEPMRAGVELVVLERREGWARVRLANEQETWLPETSIEMVTPETAS